MKETYCIYPGCGVEIPAGRVIHKCDEHIELGRLVSRSPLTGYCVICGERSTPALCDDCRPVIRLLVPGQSYYIDSHLGGVHQIKCEGYNKATGYYDYSNDNPQYPDFGPWSFTLKEVAHTVMLIRPGQFLHETDREYTERTGFSGPRAEVLHHD